jgi:uncharacterized protein (DUF3084 family)
MAKKRARRRSVRAVLVVGGQKVGTATFRNPDDAKSWARAIGVPVSDRRKNPHPRKRRNAVYRTKAEAQQEVNRLHKQAQRYGQRVAVTLKPIKDRGGGTMYHLDWRYK